MAEEISFGEMLRLERNRLGWTQEELADKLGDKAFSNNDSGDPVTRQTIIRWEGGSHFPSPHNLRNLVAALGLDQTGAEAFYRAARQALPLPEQPVEEQTFIDNLPFKRNPFFTGRETELEHLRDQLQETGTAAITQPINISGLGGIGKTELALEYAHRYYPDMYRTVLWVDADTSMLEASYANLAEILKLPERDEQKLERRFEAVKVWLKSHSNWLLIMDNADDLPLAESFLPAKPLGHIVFTTCSQPIDTIPRQIEIEAMEQEDSLLLLLRRSGKLEGKALLDSVATDIQEAALQVVKLLGGHPLALDQAGAYIDATRISFADYVERYHAERNRLLNKRGSLKNSTSRHPDSVAATIKLSFEQACGLQHLAADILHFCAFIHSDDIPEELFQHDDNFQFGTTAFDDGIEALLRYSLIKRNMQEKTLSMHRLVQAVLINSMDSDLQKQWRERIVRALNAALPERSFGPFKDWRQQERQHKLLLPSVLACADWTEDELPQTIEVAELFHKSAVYLYYTQDSVAETLQAQVLSICEKHFGTEHPATARSLHDLAIIYVIQRKYEQAESLLVRTLSILEKQLEPGHPEIIGCLYTLAAVYEGHGKYEQAEPLLLQVVSIREKQLGPEHPKTALSLCLLAQLYHVQGKYEQAELLYRRVISLWEKHLGTEHPDIAQPLIGLAYLLRAQGKYEEARALYYRAESIHPTGLADFRPGTQPFYTVYENFLHSKMRGEVDAAAEVNDEPPV